MSADYSMPTREDFVAAYVSVGMGSEQEANESYDLLLGPPDALNDALVECISDLVVQGPK